LTHLIADVLDIAKLETGVIEWVMDEVALVDVIAQAVGSIQAMAREKGLALEVAMADDLPLLWADYDRLVQVIETCSPMPSIHRRGPRDYPRVATEAGRRHPAWGERWADLPLELPAAQPLLAVSVQDTGWGLLLPNCRRSSRNSSRRRPAHGHAPPGHRPGSAHLPRDHRPPRRPALGREPGRRGQPVCVYPAHSRKK
jgi:hypothetical protein